MLLVYVQESTKFSTQSSALLTFPYNQLLFSECTRESTLCLFSFKDCKWKMYMELDGDDVAVTYIKDVIFNANQRDVEILRMTKVSSETQFSKQFTKDITTHVLIIAKCFLI